MLELAILFFLLAVIAAVFGFGGFATAFAGIAKFMLVLFIILALVMLLL
jgi:uncharacterized membrane protein YtjA (UPF0391 family)